MLAIYDAVYDILLFAKRNLDPQCLKGFMRLLFKHCVIKVFINEEPNTSRGQWCGHMLKSISWNFGSKILICVGNFCLSISGNLDSLNSELQVFQDYCLNLQYYYEKLKN